MSLIRAIPVLLSLALPGVALSHEFWLEPVNYQADAGSEIAIRFRNGQDFNGTEMSWFDRRIDRVTIVQNGEESEYKGLPGDLPGMTIELGDGLTVVGYASAMSKLTYDSWEKTLSFVRHKDVTWFEEEHAARGLPQEGVTEGYWRFSKTLVAGGDGAGEDRALGLPHELVLLDNPYTKTGPLRARLLYRGEPRPDAQIELWEKTGRDVTKTLYRTDAEGVATLEVRPGYSYQLDSVVLREPESDAATEAGVMWESLWANLTFAVPE